MIKKIFFILFFISGFCSLLYQTVWLRLAFANFGVNTQVISIVVSIFMLGLVLGSWISGKYLINIPQKYKIKSIHLYCLAELLIGVGALIVPILFSFGHNWLLSFGETNSFAYLGLSAIVLAVSLLPWCFFIGTTIPLITDYLNRNTSIDKNIFSFLYLSNTLGAMAGVMTTALILIELFGFRMALLIGAILNFLISITVLIIVKKININNNTPLEIKNWSIKNITMDEKNILILLFITGFSSVGFEVIWNRLFTPILETSVYAFAFILFIYLLGTFIGSLHYRLNLNKNKKISTKLLLLLLGIISVVQIWFVDPRLNLGILGVILCILSISYLLGYITPKQIDELSEGNPKIIGLSYAINLFGCIVGPIFASYIFMPIFGSKISIILLSLPIIIFLFIKNKIIFINKKYLFMPILILTTIAITLSFGTTYEEWLKTPNKIIKNDYNATVLATTLKENDPRSKYLMVNGVGMTMLTPITKVMAHLPLFSFKEKPDKALVICFGMGTTFRSAISWRMETTAVELTPSVVELFPYFFKDTEKLLDKNNKIIIDDGRRYLERTNEKYDLIAIDPPPPVVASGSSLLYSKEFYEIIKNHLTPNGILAQWYPEKDSLTFNAVTRSLSEVFPYIEVYGSIMGNGYHLLASKNPIIMPSIETIINKMPIEAQNDLMEWNDHNDPNISTMIERILKEKHDLKEFLNKNEKIKITDDKPYNEYFLLREKN